MRPLGPHLKCAHRCKGEEVESAVVCDLPTLVWAANLGTIEFHVPLWRSAGGASLPAPPISSSSISIRVKGPRWSSAARLRWNRGDIPGQGSRAAGEDQWIQGSPGLCRARGPAFLGEVSGRCYDVATTLEHEHPELVTSNMRKTLRRGKVLIDWSQNHPAKTTVGVYSVRATDPPDGVDPGDLGGGSELPEVRPPVDLEFTTSDVLARVEKQGDLFTL